MPDSRPDVSRGRRFQAARIRRLRPGLQVLETRVDDFDVRAVVVQGARGVLVWDALAHPDQMAPVAPLLVGRAVTLAYSHADWDHVLGAGALGMAQEVLAHRLCAERFVQEVPDDLRTRLREDPARWQGARVVPPTRTFDADEVPVDLGGVSVRLTHLPGHTPDCAVGWVPEWGVLLAGDAVETPLPVVNDGQRVRQWADQLRTWEMVAGLTCVVPSHGRIGGGEVIRETAEYLEGLLEGKAEAPKGADDPFYARTHAENLRHAGL